VQGTLGALGLRWYLFGAQAAIVHGSARLTADVDITVEQGTVPTRELIRAMEGAGFALRIPDSEDFVARTRVVPLTDERTRLPVDLVLAGAGFEELFMERARVMDVGGARIPVARAEDLVAMKVLAGRPKDLEDALAVIAANGEELDLDLVRSTLHSLEEALAQSDLLPALEGLLRDARR